MTDTERLGGSRSSRRLTRRRLLGALAVGAMAPVTPPAAKSLLGLGAILEPIRRQYDLPALAAAVIVAGRTAAHSAVGVRKYGDAVPVTDQDQFHLGSCTKAMTATLCGMLVEQGRLRWDTTLADALPDLPMAPAYRAMTLDHLLAHRSGFSAETSPLGKTLLDLHALPGPPEAQRRAYLRLILREAPVSAPGTQFLYSNRNYAALGAALEHAAGTPWEALIQHRLFKPLGMTTAEFGAMGTPGRTDQPWQHTISDGKHTAIGPGPHSDNPPAIAPAGTVHCAVGDWAKFAVLHLQGEQGTSRLLRPQTLRRLHAPRFGGQYAGGWLVLDRSWGGGQVLTHAGSNTMNYAVAWLAPLKDFGVLVMTNQGGDQAAAATDAAASALISHFLGPNGV